ncbi:glycosyltransferase [Micromonospora arborensis]|uniref:glycosyltransferase n=1 Tax=Micromonospora arborensis TaxID=2116518 RepID=UPI00341A7BF7
MSLEEQARRAYRVYQRYRQHGPPTIRLRGTSSGAPTIYYLARDYNEPSGGIRTLYRHVDVLNEAGVAAAVLHERRGFRCSWFPNQTRVTDVRSSPLGPDDLLVVPETDARLLPRLPASVRHVVFNQSGHLTWNVDAELVTRHYLGSPGLLGVMVVSEHSQDLLEYAFRRPVHRVRLSVDTALFNPPDRPNGRVLSYMPRRGRADVENVLHLLRARGALGGWTVDAVDGVPQEGVARRLRASTIFLSSCYQEGFGLPAVEAMASGNYVIGFHGFGGREFFDPDFSRPTPTGDLLAMGRALEECLIREAEQPGWCWSRGVEAARHVRAEYSADRESASILAFFKEIGHRP